MTGSVRGRAAFTRALVAFGAVAILALLALAALLLGGAFSDDGGLSGAHVHAAATTAVGDHDHGIHAVHAFHQQPSTRARSVALLAFAAVGIAAVATYRRRQFASAGRLRTLRISGLPPGRAPPTPQIV